MKDLVIRCSSIGHLMAKPENADLDPAYVTPELTEIIAKRKRTDEEQAKLDHARRHSLSAGGKTHVRKLVREEIFGYVPGEIETRPIMKGRAVESACIELLARLTGRPLVKNALRRTDGFISGECDVWDEPIRHGRDVKAAYSMETMPIVLADCIDSGYEWQMRGYMKLWQAQTWSVDYLLVSTPEEFVGYEPPELHFVDHIDELHRWTSWTVHRDLELEALIDDKVRAARRYARQVIAEFDRTHGTCRYEPPRAPVAAPAARAPAPTPSPSAAPAPRPAAVDLATLDF